MNERRLRARDLVGIGSRRSTVDGYLTSDSPNLSSGLAFTSDVPRLDQPGESENLVCASSNMSLSSLAVYDDCRQRCPHVRLTHHFPLET